MTAAPLLRVRSLTKTFGREVADDLLLPGCYDLSLDLEAGETIGIVGESGSGKTTFGRCIAGLQAFDSGELLVRGQDVRHMSGAARRHFRRTVQIVFQNPETAVNPRMTAGRFVAEPLRNFGMVRRADEAARLIELGALVGLDRDQLSRYPHQLSGGQKQRIGLMRALACEPEIVVLDEPTSALDVSVQAQVLATLHELQRRTTVSFILISHDIGVIRQMCSRVFVMYLGRIVEHGDTESVLSAPRHPYTRALIDAVPRVKGHSREPFELQGDLAFGRARRSACPLLPRCPLAIDQCRQMPPLAAVGRGHEVACWRATAADRPRPTGAPPAGHRRQPEVNFNR